MKLSDRLEKIIELVPPCGTAADIGTDHGFVPVELVRRGRVSHAFACDVGSGPLKRAEEHIAEAGLSDRIELRLGDGVRVLKPGEADSVIITGMGGSLINRILRDGSDALEGTRYLILSPHTDVYEVRKFIDSKGWQIAEESVVFEDGKYYVIMRAELSQGTCKSGSGDHGIAAGAGESIATERNGTGASDGIAAGVGSDPYGKISGSCRKLTEEELIYGPCLIRDRTQTFLDYMEHEKQKIQDILAKFADCEPTPEIAVVEQEKHRELMMIMKILGEL